MTAPTRDRPTQSELGRMVACALCAFTRFWFRFRVHGAKNLPDRPCIIAGNHSAIGVVDVLCLVGASSAELEGRRAVGMMHDLFIRMPLLGRICRAFGAVRASPDAARAALRDGCDVVVYPGGNVDSCRPFTEPREIVFGSHRGYVRLALDAGAPIVPLVTLGSALTYLLLPGMDPIARLIGLRRFSRDERLAIPVAFLGVLAVAAGALAGAWSPYLLLVALLWLFVPNPVRVTTHVLAPIDVCALTEHIADRDARVEAAHRIVLGAMQRHLSTMQHGPSGESRAVAAHTRRVRAATTVR